MEGVVKRERVVEMRGSKRDGEGCERKTKRRKPRREKTDRDADEGGQPSLFTLFHKHGNILL